MIKSKSEKLQGPIEIDLTGPDGNAYVLLAMMSKWAKQLGLDYNVIRDEATSSDYENLLNVLEKYFGEYVILYR